MNDKKPVKPNSLCQKCRSNLIHKSKFGRNDPWMALEVVSLLTLVNVALNDNRFHIMYGADPYAISKIKCLGCFLPSTMVEIIETARETRDINKVKEIGEK